eukprot:7869776-Lingulodinium_polyedra.AAC.1
MARRHASSSACGLSWVLSAQKHRSRRIRAPVAQAGPATPRPTASITRGGSPAMLVLPHRWVKVTGERARAARAC